MSAWRDASRAFARRHAVEFEGSTPMLRLIADEIDECAELQRNVVDYNVTRRCYVTAENLRIAAEELDRRPFGGSIAEAMTVRCEAAEARAERLFGVVGMLLRELLQAEAAGAIVVDMVSAKTGSGVARLTLDELQKLAPTLCQYAQGTQSSLGGAATKGR